MDNNIINNDAENVRRERKYIINGIKKEQNYAASALILMMIVGVLLSAFTPDVSSLVQGVDEKYVPLIKGFYDGISYCMYVGVPMCFMFFVRRGGTRIRFKRKLPEHMWASAGFCLGAMYFANVLANAVTSCASRVGIEFPSASVSTEFVGVPHFLLTVITSAMLPAFLEEIFLRGCIMGSIARYDKTTALIISSMLFGLMHLNPIQNLFATVAGLAIGYFVLRYESLWFGVVVHFSNNFIAIIKNALYQGEADHLVLSVAIDIAVFVCGVLSTVYLIKKGSLFSRKDEGEVIFAVSDIMLIYIALALAISYMQISV